MELNHEEIKAILPHRYPFLLIDRVTEGEPGTYCVAEKNISANEWQFQGHFPQQAIMPGVLIVEALAQCGAVALLSLPEFEGRIALLAGVDKARFKRQVIPGDCLVLDVRVKKLRRTIGTAEAVAKVDGQIAVQCELMFAVADAAEENKPS